MSKAAIIPINKDWINFDREVEGKKDINARFLPITSNELTGLPRFMTVVEVSKLFSVHPTSVYEWIRDGSLKAHNIGAEKRKTWRIYRDHLAIFLASRSV